MRRPPTHVPQTTLYLLTTLWENKIHASGAAAIARALEDNTVLKWLVLAQLVEQQHRGPGGHCNCRRIESQRSVAAATSFDNNKFILMLRGGCQHFIL